MLKKIGFYISVTIVILLCVYSIFLMYQTDTKYDVSIDSSEIYADYNSNDAYIVQKGDITQTIQLKGTVAPVYDAERIEVFIEEAPDKIEKYVNPGDVLEENDVYAKCDGYEYKSDSKLRCVSVETEVNGIGFVFIDYGKLYIDVCIPEEYVEDSLYNRKIIVKKNETEFSGKISYIDTYCSGGTVNSRIAYESKEILLRPGSECSVNIVLEHKEDIVAVPLEYVIYSKYEDKYRINLVNGDKTMTVEVKVGIIGDEMVEIISGVNENDYIMFPAPEMSLEYYLNNS